MALIGQGLPAGVTCESLGVNEDPLNGLPIFLAQLQADLTGAVSLGPVGQEWEQGKVKQGRSAPEVTDTVICRQRWALGFDIHGVIL